MDTTPTPHYSLFAVSTAPQQGSAPRSTTYEGLGGVAFFTVLLLSIVIAKRLPKSWHQLRWSKRLMDRLRA